MEREPMEPEGWQALHRAIYLEGLLFDDMTLARYPEITEDVDYIEPQIGNTPFYVRDLGDGVLGEYDPDRRCIILADGYTDSVLAHEMIHYYEHRLNDITPELSQLIACDLWQQLDGKVPEMRRRVVSFLELRGHGDLEAEGGRHDVLFLLKSWDIDLSLGLPLSTTLGYGYAETWDEGATEAGRYGDAPASVSRDDDSKTTSES